VPAHAHIDRRRSVLAGGPSAVSFALLLLVAYLVLLPIVVTVVGSLTSAPTGVLAEWTLVNYRRALAAPSLRSSAIATFVFSGSTTALTTVLAAMLGLAVERTRTRTRPLLIGLVLIPVVMPGVVLATAWSTLANPRVGLLNQLGLLLGRTEPFVNAHSMPVMILAETAENLPLAFLLVAVALRHLDPSLEEAAQMAGASWWWSVRTVTLPVIRPALLTAALLTFLRSIGSFTVPLVLGVPGGIRVLATEVYLASRLFPSDAGTAAAFAVLHLGIAGLAFVAYQRTTRHAASFTTISGRSAHAGARDATRGSGLLGVTCLVILVAMIALPVLTVIVSSLQPGPVRVGTLRVDSLTWDNYRWVATSTLVRRAVRNSLVAGIGASCVVVMLGALIAWVSARGRGAARRSLDTIASLPLAVPGSVLGVALLWWYLVIPNPFYATLWLIGLAYVTAFLPYAVRALAIAVGQVHVELEEASTMSGASRGRTFLRIVLPIVAPGALATALYVLTRTLRALALPAMLAGPGDEVVAVLIYELHETLRYHEMHALGLSTTLLVLLLVITARGVVAVPGRVRRASARRGPAAMLEAER
jgi:iron(III) transport system permease protein